MVMTYKQLLHLNITIILLLMVGLYAGMAGAHGKVAMAQDSCMRYAGTSMVHLSA